MSNPNCGAPHQSGTIGGADSKPVVSQVPFVGELSYGLSAGGEPERLGGSFKLFPKPF